MRIGDLIGFDSSGNVSHLSTNLFAAVLRILCCAMSVLGLDIGLGLYYLRLVFVCLLFVLLLLGGLGLVQSLGRASAQA